MSVENLIPGKSGEKVKTMYSWTQYFLFYQSLITRDKII